MVRGGPYIEEDVIKIEKSGTESILSPVFEMVMRCSERLNEELFMVNKGSYGN